MKVPTTELTTISQNRGFEKSVIQSVGVMKIMKQSRPDSIEIAKAGINRFWDEGYTKWPRAKLQSLFLNKSLDGDQVQEAFSDWENEGYIRIILESDVYIEVLKPIE